MTNKYTNMYLKYIYLMLSILQNIYIIMYLKNTLYFYCWHTKQLILCLMHFNCAEVVLDILKYI